MVVSSNRKRKLAAVVGVGAVAAGTLAALGGTSEGATKASPASSISGQTINVAIAYPAPKAMLAEFTKQTGVKVNWNYIQWDALQTKIASAAQAKSYFADVTDVDWSKIGEYYTTKWFMPLNKYFSPATVSKQFPQAASFIRNGQLVGIPMDASMLVSTENTSVFKQAGIKSVPKTLTQYEADLKQIAAKTDVKTPLDIPFAAAEGLSTYWYETTAAFGGQVLSSNYSPEFTSPSSPGYKAMAFMVQQYKDGLVPQAALNEQDYQALQTDQAHKRTVTALSEYSGDIATIYNVKSDSTVVGQMKYIPTPGVKGPASNLGNPDGIGIPVNAQHVAAAVAFIKWMEEPKNQAAFAGADGTKDEISTFPLPSNRQGMKDLVKSGKVAGASDLENLLDNHSQPIFPAGAPPWYAQFSTAVQTNLHQVVSGSESLSSAISSIAGTVNSLKG